MTMPDDYLRYPLRAAADLLASVASTRISAIENYAHAQVALMVRRLEQRLVEATSSEGDWRLALFRNARTLLQPLDATALGLRVGDTAEVSVSNAAPLLVRGVFGPAIARGVVAFESRC